MGRQVNPDIPEAGYVSKEQFENTGTIAQSDFAICPDQNNSKKITFDASAVTSTSTIKAHTSGTLDFSNGTSGYVMTSNGSGAPTWQAVPSSPYTPPVTRIKVYHPTGYGSVASSKIFTFDSTEYSLGSSDVSYTRDTVNGDYFTTTVAGIYSISLGLYMAAASNVGLSLNISGADFTTVYNSLTHDKQLTVAFAGNGNGSQISVTRYCAAGDKIYPHGGTGNVGGINSENFQIVRLS